MSFPPFSFRRGLIAFDDKSYVLEPMDNVTGRYKLFAAEALKGVWGSCGARHSTSGPAAGGGRPPPSRTRVRRRESRDMTLGPWAPARDTGAGTSEGLFHGGCVWG